MRVFFADGFGRRRAGLLAIVAAMHACTPVSAGDSERATAPAEDLAAYAALGFVVAEKIHLQQLQWSEAQLEAFISGFRRNFEHGSAITLDATSQPVFTAINDEIQRAQVAVQTRDATGPLQLLVKQLGLEPTELGAFVRILRGGSGARPTPADTVVISLSARTADTGDDVPALNAENLRVKVADLPPGLAYGAQLVALEGHALLLVPPELSFGRGQWPAGVPRGSPLLYILRLHDIVSPDAAPPS